MNFIFVDSFYSGGSKKIENYQDIQVFKEKTGCSSVMIARAAEWNSSIFRKEGKLDLHDVIRTYLKLAIDYDNTFTNSKYNVQNILRELQETPLGRKFLATQLTQELR